MILYAGAQEIDLGFLFMIQPITIFARPFICAQADRYQSHQKMLAFYALLTSFSYIPFVIMPFVVGHHDGQTDNHQERTRFWLMVVFHTIGSIGFCGVRSLGDGTAVNFAKRFGTDFARYRKYGSISYGICGYLIGRINQHWLLPDFVPGLLMYCSCMSLLALLVYLWPSEYFKMTAGQAEQNAFGHEDKLPSAGETFRHLMRGLVCMQAKDNPEADRQKGRLEIMDKVTKNGLRTTMTKAGGITDPKLELAYHQRNGEEAKNLSAKQQFATLKLLVRRDFRLVLYLLVIFYNGLVAYSGPNFVFTYLNETCRRKGTCNGAELAGLVMISYCTVETIGYMIIDKLRGHLNRVLMLEIAFLSVIVHYFFYGLLLDSLSPYWFLVESLHGVEYSIGLSTSVELGYYFAREVELLIPELISNGIISEQDDKDRVKVSLMATLSGCYTFMYDGIGCIVGCLIFGLTTGLYSFRITWLLIGSMSVVGFVALLVAWLIGKLFHIRPEILELKQKRQSQTSSC